MEPKRSILTELKGHQTQIQSAAFSEDRKLILTHAENNTLRVRCVNKFGII
ncbi:hypothetical protein PL921440017 [Planktothrix tepida PCC 9214]|uniref:Uncharacterized protein n=1 Tax=Planktothrix tepida PCC 9214 TaxID=671072 RepID=A0A1J1LHJ5_9CYAN|nr:hypothetical protein PL921440017 [Planktothrix tepida PCC 9214]